MRWLRRKRRLHECDCGNPEGHVGAVWHPGQPVPPDAKIVGPIKKDLPVNGAREAEMSLVVMRCGCGDPDSHNGKNGPACPCPKPKRSDDIGRVGYWHHNPFKRAWWDGWGQTKANQRIKQFNEVK